MELLHAQWILDNPHVKQTRSPQLTELLVKLRQVAYDADDVLDELEYYRIQDDLDGTQHATNVDDDGGGLLLHARSTANAIGKSLTCCSFPSAADDPRHRTPRVGGSQYASKWAAIFLMCLAIQGTTEKT
ncbi:unnamed protein product [Miscanthus lutarioriparius]|uniref:Disease resistance N-terminal domain-containing protein n=1 Tax=Miscanthus lutarioriparius TaxID=422564 RepID=A0A811QRK6_9POAL|nr:unnamed protein product [Miscanthus lutarioriparius]